MLFNVKEAVDNYVTASVAKSKATLQSMIVKAFL